MEKDPQDELNEIYEQLNEGDITVEDAMQRSNALTAELASKKGAEQATQKMGNIFQEREAKEIQDKFLEEHPDFAELRDAGKLESIKQQSPMHDDVSAYFAYRAEHGPEESSIVEETEEIKEPLPTLSDDQFEDGMLKAIKET